MMRINTTATANISKVWIKPPNVYEVTIPSSQRTISKTKIVQSMEHLQIAILANSAMALFNRIFRKNYRMHRASQNTLFGHLCSLTSTTERLMQLAA